MNINLVTMAAEHSATMDGIASLLRMMCDPPAGASWAALANSISAITRLADIAKHEADDIFVALTAEETEEAPETAGTETDADEIKDQVDDTTQEPKTSKRTRITPELKMELISCIKKGEPATKVAADLGIGVSTAFRIKAEAM